MKKLLSLLFSLALSTTLVSCGQQVSSGFNERVPPLRAPNREAFTHEVPAEVSAYFGDVTPVKAYLHWEQNWFLAEELTDFSQALTENVIYVVPGGPAPEEQDAAWSIYSVNDAGEIQWDSSAFPPEDTAHPYGFDGLTHAVIEESLAEVEYEDYIVTYAPLFSAVFVWVRGLEDCILAYPTRPDLMGLEIGGLYTLNEVSAALSTLIE